MEIESVTDVKLVGRALSNGWLDGQVTLKQRAVESLAKIIESNIDPEMQIKAFDALVRADKADLKRAEVAIKKQDSDDQRRLRLLEFIKHLSPGDIAKIASDDKAAAEHR